jgi:hypothetical protein
MARRYLTYEEMEELGVRRLHGMTLHGREFRLPSYVLLDNDNEIPQTKGIVELTITPRENGQEILLATGDGMFTLMTPDSQNEFTINRAGIYDINGGVIYQPELPGIVNILVILSSLHNETIHTYRPPPNVIIIHAHESIAGDAGVKVNVNEDKIATLMALLAGLRHSNKEGHLGKINRHPLYTKDAFRGVARLATQAAKRTTPDYGDFNGRVAHDLKKYNYGSKPQEDEVREPKESVPYSYNNYHPTPGVSRTAPASRASPASRHHPAPPNNYHPTPGAGQIVPAARASPSYRSNSPSYP